MLYTYLWFYYNFNNSLLENLIYASVVVIFKSLKGGLHWANFNINHNQPSLVELFWKCFKMVTGKYEIGHILENSKETWKEHCCLIFVEYERLHWTTILKI
jgi:hypothetical protein